MSPHKDERLGNPASDGERMEGERTREPALPPRPANWHDPRKRPAHCVMTESDRATVVFLTVCTKDRLPWLASNEVHAILRDVWTESTAWLAGRYVIMPDNLHILAGWTGASITLETWVRYWKRLFSVRYGNRGHRWKAGHWDTTMQTIDQCEEKWQYMLNNPVRHKLVTVASQWPYSGVVHDFVWT